MEKEMKYHIYYFSATGNTEHSVKMIEETIRKDGHSCKTVRINGSTGPLQEIPDRLVIAFPVLAWRPPVFVAGFLKKLPKTKAGTNAAVLAVGGGKAMGAADSASGILDKRGYSVQIRAVAIYADNWLQVSSPPVGNKRKKKNAEGEEAVSDFCKALGEDKPWRNYQKKPLHKFADMISALFAVYGRRFLGKMFIADSKCNSCRICKNSCPVNAISMGKGKKAKPFWKYSCESCNRCINICPKKAINSSIPRIVILCAFIGLCLVFGIKAWARFVQPLYSDFAQWLSVIISIAGYTAVVLLSHILPLLLLDPAIMRPLQALKPVRKVMEISFTRNFNRYTYDGFKPPREI